MESQRYVAYDSEKHGQGEITFIVPTFATEQATVLFKESLKVAENTYCQLRAAGAHAEDARAVLPNATATQLYMTANLREWRHFIEMRAAPAAQGEIRILAKELHRQLVAVFPCLFDDLVFK